jgi:hyaluronoglucosaminidase
MAAWLPRLGLDAYLYAPKADRYLRRNWQRPWPREQAAELRGLAAECARTGLLFGVGLSPFALYDDFSARQQRVLRTRVEQINDIGAPLLALLFDDMPGSRGDLAAVQAEIAATVRETSAASFFLVCPTYYSHDAVLDRVFGQRPPNYLHELARRLPDGTGLFWTGSAVCSERIREDDLPDREARADLDLALWDNYPVNDSARRSPHLYTAPLAGRSPDMDLAWHWCNAMNQAALSLPALHSLAALYGRAGDDAAQVFADAGISDGLLAACRALDRLTPADLDPVARAVLQEQAARTTPAGRELSAYLAGEYRFDPACLTD